MSIKTIENALRVVTAKGHTIGEFDTAQCGVSQYYRAQCKKCGARIQIEVNGESITDTGRAYTEECVTFKH